MRGLGVNELPIGLKAEQMYAEQATWWDCAIASSNTRTRVGREYVTHHATVRVQQRAIPPVILQWLADYGTESHDGRGGIKRFFDHRSRKRLAREVGSTVIRRLESYLDTYLVETIDGTVITAGHRTGRMRRS